MFSKSVKSDEENLITHDIRQRKQPLPNRSKHYEYQNISHDERCGEIVAVFVIDYHFKSGNMIEWCMPGDINYTGLEFKAMVSGLHHVKSDFIYFRHLNYYGIGCFGIRPTDEKDSRGVRMKTVGVLSTSYFHLHNYIGFLDTAVRNLLINPGNYDRLVAFYSDQMMRKNGQNIKCSSIDLSDVEINGLRQFDCHAFIEKFGVKILMLWKLVLLRKRILFIELPPIGQICQQVLFCHQLDSHDITQIQYLRSRPVFNISLSDIDNAASSFWQENFIACSTEQILLMKKCCYDCYVQDSIIQLVNESDDNIQRAVATSSSDKQKFEKLINIRSQFDHLSNSWEECVISFFKSENNRLFNALLDISQSADAEITSYHVEQLGFHPKEDRHFLLLLLETYGIDVVLHVESSCC